MVGLFKKRIFGLCNKEVVIFVFICCLRDKVLIGFFIKLFSFKILFKKVMCLWNFLLGML